jgi:alpha-ribazole phosphatase
MELIIVRHGLSVANVKDIASGRYDSRLTEEGKQQARNLASRLRGLEIEKIYSSPLKRTMQTALPIAEILDISIDVDRRLAEVHFGSFEGGPNAEVERVLGKTPREFFNSYEYDFSPYGGESSKEVESRVKSFLDDLKKQDYKLVVLVTHGGIIRWINYLITGEKRGPLPNAEELHLNHK